MKKLAGAMIALMAVDVLAHGLMLPFLGFYHDDWPVIWAYALHGVDGLRAYHAGFRPVYGALQAWLFPVLGFSPLAWHALTLLLSWAAAASLFLLIVSLWPTRWTEAWVVSLLAMLYPGFSEQPVAVSYFPHFFSLALILSSLTATVWATRLPRVRWLLTAVSVVLAIGSYLFMDYFVGLEFVRPLVIAFASMGTDSKKTRPALRSVLAAWGPYLATFAVPGHVAAVRLSLGGTWV